MTIELRHNIRVDGHLQLSNPAELERYERTVATIFLGDLLISQVGRIVIESINAIPRMSVQIVPWTAPHSNAMAVPLDPLNTVRRGEAIHRRDGSVRGFGSGAGSSSVVRFSPGRLAQYFNPFQPNTPIHLEPSATLLHELCHCLRQMMGVVTSVRMSNAMDNREEFFAITVTNVYSSLRHGALRGGHGVEPYQADAWHHDPQIQAALLSIRQTMPTFWQRMSQLDAPFNPFRG